MTWKNDDEIEEDGEERYDEGRGREGEGEADGVPHALKGRRNLTGRYRGIFARRGARRLAVEEVLRRAELLPRVARAIVFAALEAGVPVKELAMLHRVPPLKMWRCLNHWRDTLSDPTFLLAAKFRDLLPHELEVLAEMHWIRGEALREVAGKRKMTMHEVRKKLARARSMLLLAASRQGKGAAESVGKLL